MPNEIEEPEMINPVELVADDDECAWDTPCKHGHSVIGHATYCHNSEWKDAPRKCRRGGYCEWLFTGKREGKNRFQDCPGFAPNDPANVASRYADDMICAESQ